MFLGKTFRLLGQERDTSFRLFVIEIVGTILELM